MDHQDPNTFPPPNPNPGVVDKQAHARLNAVEAQVDGMRSQLQRVETEVSGLNGTLNSMTSQMAAVQADLKWLRMHHVERQDASSKTEQALRSARNLSLALGTISLLASVIAGLLGFDVAPF